jgi:hypothetical protein
MRFNFQILVEDRNVIVEALKILTLDHCKALKDGRGIVRSLWSFRGNTISEFERAVSTWNRVSFVATLHRNDRRQFIY